MYTPFPHPRYESFEGHHPLQHSPGVPPREFTDLSSIDLCADDEEEEERPCSSAYGYPTREPEDQRRPRILAAAAGLLAVSALCACVAAFGVSKASLPSLAQAQAPPPSAALPVSSLPRLPGRPAASTASAPRGGLTARQLLEGGELTELAASRYQAADPRFVQLAGAAGVRDGVAEGFRSIAAPAAPELDALQLTLEQKDAVLGVLRDMSDNERLHSTGLFVARALQEGRNAAADQKGVARFVLERLRPRLPELRRLRDEVIPASLRSGDRHGVLTLDSEKMKFVESLGNRWHVELDASMPKVSHSQRRAPATPRRLAQLGIDAHTGRFIEAMRSDARDAKGALATTNGDLTTAVHGLDTAKSRATTDSADQQQIAKSLACDAITEATNAMDTVELCLTQMMARLAQANTTVETAAGNGKARKTVAKRIFKQLKADVARVKETIATDKAKFQQTLAAMRPLVSKVDDNSLVLTRSNLMYVQGEVQKLQGELFLSLKAFGTLYDVVKGHGKLLDTVRLYASSVYYQLQEQFQVRLPNVGNASVMLQECLQDPEGLFTELQCRLTYAKMCLEFFLGMDADISVEMPTSSTSASIPLLPAMASANPLMAASATSTSSAPSTTTRRIQLPQTVTVSTTTAPVHHNQSAQGGPLNSGWKALGNLGSTVGHALSALNH